MMFNADELSGDPPLGPSTRIGGRGPDHCCQANKLMPVPRNLPRQVLRTKHTSSRRVQEIKR
jgi:hypothetical protein